MRKRFVPSATLVAVLLIVTACQTIRSIPYERNDQIVTIAVPTVRMEQRPAVKLASSTSENVAAISPLAGLIGALIESGIASEREASLAAILAEREFDSREALTEALVSALTERGYEVVRVDEVARPDAKFLEDYPPTEPPADAYLDVVVTAHGYLAAGAYDSTPFRPHVYTQVRLVSPEGRVLMEDHVVYNHVDKRASSNGVVQQVTISPAPGYQYVSFSDLEASPDEAAEGLVRAIGETAETIGVLLQ